MLYESILAFAPAFVIGLILLALVVRSAQLRESAESLRKLAEAHEHGSHTPRLVHPSIDLSKCIGCGACICACPEEGVLELIRGQAVVIHGSRCVSHGECGAVCPAGAVTLTLGDTSQRRDLPAIDPSFAVVGVPGLFLAGELTGFALVRTAVSQGIAAANAVGAWSPNNRRCEISHRLFWSKPRIPCLNWMMSWICSSWVPGPEDWRAPCAKQLELQFQTIEQETHLGGTIAAYPRNKLVMTQPLELPMYGRLLEKTYSKEKLISIWIEAASANALPIRTGVKLLDLKRGDDGVFTAITTDGQIRARNVCLALGRRGSPRKLGVPGEDLSKVNYSLLDAEAYTHRLILVVGGGDSAIEAALALSREPGNQVTISYRRGQFTRIKAHNEQNIAAAMYDRKVDVIFDSEVTSIEEDRVHLPRRVARERPYPTMRSSSLPGAIPLSRCSSSPAFRLTPRTVRRQSRCWSAGTGLLVALLLTFACAVFLGLWAFWFRSYYSIDPELRHLAGTLEAAAQRSVGIVLRHHCVRAVRSESDVSGASISTVGEIPRRHASKLDGLARFDGPDLGTVPAGALRVFDTPDRGRTRDARAGAGSDYRNHRPISLRTISADRQRERSEPGGTPGATGRSIR